MWFFKGDIRSIEKVQKRGTKLILSIRDLTYEYRLHELKLPSLCHRRKRGDMIYTYKILTGKLNMKQEDFLKMTHLSTRGNGMKIFKKHATKLPRINSFSNRIVNNWNSLTKNIVSADSVLSFKAELDKHWIDTKYETPF